jgi:hypothetical protein
MRNLKTKFLIVIRNIYLVKNLQLGALNLTFVFRHKWDKQTTIVGYSSLFRTYKLGFWFKINKIVSTDNFSNPKTWHNYLIKDYMLGIDLLVCTCWVEINYKGKILTTK